MMSQMMIRMIVQTDDATNNIPVIAYRNRAVPETKWPLAISTIPIANDNPGTINTTNVLDE
jgi:hypothetical protein